MNRADKIQFLKKLLTGKATVKEFKALNGMDQFKVVVWNKEGELYIGSDGSKLTEEQFKMKGKGLTNFHGINVLIVPPLDDDEF